MKSELAIDKGVGMKIKYMKAQLENIVKEDLDEDLLYNEYKKELEKEYKSQRTTKEEMLTCLALVKEKI